MYSIGDIFRVYNPIYCLPANVIIKIIAITDDSRYVLDFNNIILTEDEINISLLPLA